MPETTSRTILTKLGLKTKTGTVLATTGTVCDAIQFDFGLQHGRILRIIPVNRATKYVFTIVYGAADFVIYGKQIDNSTVKSLECIKKRSFPKDWTPESAAGKYMTLTIYIVGGNLIAFVDGMTTLYFIRELSEKDFNDWTVEWLAIPLVISAYGGTLVGEAWSTLELTCRLVLGKWDQSDEGLNDEEKVELARRKHDINTYPNRYLLASSLSALINTLVATDMTFIVCVALSEPGFLPLPLVVILSVLRGICDLGFNFQQTREAIFSFLKKCSRIFVKKTCIIVSRCRRRPYLRWRCPVSRE